MAANMLAAYYDRDCDTKEFFDKLKISQSEEYLKHLNQYDVLKINMLGIFERNTEHGGNVKITAKEADHRFEKQIFFI